MGRHGLIDSVYIQGKREGTIKGTVTGFVIGIIFTLIGVKAAKKIIK